MRINVWGFAFCDVLEGFAFVGVVGFCVFWRLGRMVFKFPMFEGFGVIRCFEGFRSLLWGFTFSGVFARGVLCVFNVNVGFAAFPMFLWRAFCAFSGVFGWAAEVRRDEDVHDERAGYRDEGGASQRWSS